MVKTEGHHCCTILSCTESIQNESAVKNVILLSKMQFSNDHAYVYATIVVPVLILAVWLIVVCSNALVAYNTKEHWILSRNIVLCTFAVLVFVVVCFFIPIPNHLFVRRQKIEDRLTLFAQGANSNIYEENGRLWKAMQTLPNFHSNSKIEIKCCNRKKDKTCTVPLIIFRKLHVLMMMISWQRIRMLQEKGDDIIRFFPYIYYIDTKSSRVVIDSISDIFYVCLPCFHPSIVIQRLPQI